MRLVVPEAAQDPHQPLRDAFDLLRARRWDMAQTTAAERLARLARLKVNLVARREALAEALFADFRKPRAEVESTEVLPVLLELAHTARHLKAWMKPRRVGAPVLLAGTRSEVHAEAKGVVLVLSPWNYPFCLAINPLIAAVAAGNCVMLKPSERTPHTAAFLETLVRDTFEPSEVTVVQGGPEVGDALLQLPFDHFFFTGGGRVGQKVMAAAARHLAGVTLELGGKSPVVVDATADVKAAAERIIWGKFVNAGQTCIAPDHVYVHASREEALLAGMKEALERFYGKTEEARRASPDLCRMVDAAAFTRVRGLLDRTVQAGARLVAGGGVDAASRYIAPTVLADVTARSPVMEEEIFGPLLPVLRYEQTDALVERLREEGKPLALYLFSQDEAAVDALLKRTSAGGTVVNNVLLQVTNPHLPFGGVGPSGLGAYHGEEGFRELSHARAVLFQGRASLAHFFFPPYTGKAQQLARLASRMFE
jgi:aldehyde dehydrogenase (NAD+)